MGENMKLITENLFFIGDKEYIYKVYEKSPGLYEGVCDEFYGLKHKASSLNALFEAFTVKLTQITKQ